MTLLSSTKDVPIDSPRRFFLSSFHPTISSHTRGRTAWMAAWLLAGEVTVSGWMDEDVDRVEPRFPVILPEGPVANIILSTRRIIFSNICKCMPLFGPAHPSPVRIEQHVVAGFLKAYTEKSNRANVGVIPEVIKTVEKALAHAKKKNKKVKLWKINLNDKGINNVTTEILVETLLAYPIVAHLDLRNNLIGDKGAVSLLQTMRGQYHAAMIAQPSEEIPGSLCIYSCNCNLLHNIELDGNGVNMQDETTLLEALGSHQAVLKDVNKWVEMKSVFEQTTYNDELDAKQGRTALKALRVKVQGGLGCPCNRTKFFDTVAPLYLGCRQQTPPELPPFLRQRFSVGTQQLFEDVGKRMRMKLNHNGEPLLPADEGGNDADEARATVDPAPSDLAMGAGSEAGADSPVSAGGKNLQQSTPEAPSPWSAQFSSFHSSLATAPHGRRHSMTRSTFYEAPGGATVGGGPSSMRSVAAVDPNLAVQTSSGRRKTAAVGDIPSTGGSPALKKPRITAVCDIIPETTAPETTPDTNEDTMVDEALRISTVAQDSESADEAFAPADVVESKAVPVTTAPNAVNASDGEACTDKVFAGESSQASPSNASDAAGEHSSDETSEDLDASEEVHEHARGNNVGNSSALVLRDRQAQNQGLEDEDWDGTLKFNNRRMKVLKGVGIDWSLFSTRLHTLDLSSNALESIGLSTIGNAGKMMDTTFPSMPVLKHLNLSKNEIVRLEEMAFHLLPMLESVDLSHNRIVRIQGFESSLNLKSLLLQNNRIRVIEGIGQLRCLEALNLSNNNISNIVALRPLSLNVGLRSLHMQGNPVAFERRYRASLISFVPHLDHIDRVPLPPSSAQKAARRAAHARDEMIILRAKKNAGSLNSPRGSPQSRAGSPKLLVMTPSKRRAGSGLKKSSNTPGTSDSTRKFIHRINEGKEETKIDFEKELNLLIFEREEEDKKHNRGGGAISTLLAKTSNIVKSKPYVDRRHTLSNEGIVPDGLKVAPVPVDPVKQQERVAEMSEPKFVAEKVKKDPRYGFGALPVPKGFHPATIKSSPVNVKVPDKRSSARRGTYYGSMSPNSGSNSPAIPQITLRLAELSTPRSYSSRDRHSNSSGKKRPWGAGGGGKQKHESLFQKQRQKASKKGLESLPGWHTPPLNADMVKSFRREFRPVLAEQESPALINQTNQEAGKNGLVKRRNDIGIEMVTLDEGHHLYSSNGENASPVIPDVEFRPLEADEKSTWLTEEQLDVLKKLFQQLAGQSTDGKVLKDKLVKCLRSEEELAAIAHLPMKTGFISSDGVEEWTTLFDCFVTLEDSPIVRISWPQFLYLFTPTFLENAANGLPHIISAPGGYKKSPQTIMGTRSTGIKAGTTKHADEASDDPLAITRMRQWIHAAEEDFSSTMSALEMLLRMYEANDYNKRSVNSYRHRLVDLEIFDMIEPNQIVRASMESVDHSNLDILEDVRSMTVKLREVKSAVKDLLDVMENYGPGEKVVEDHVRRLLRSTVGRELLQRKGGVRLPAEEVTPYQYDNVSVASSAWSLEAQSSVKSFHPQNNQNNHNIATGGKFGESNDASSTASDNLSVGSGGKAGSLQLDLVSAESVPEKVEDTHTITTIETHQVLHIHCNGADSLKKVDFMGHSDPYCKVYVNDKKIGKTRHINNTATPSWNETFHVDLKECGGQCNLRFEVFDYDRIGDHDFHGVVSIPGAEVEKLFGKHNVKFPLKPDETKKKKFNSDVGGNLSLSFSVMEIHDGDKIEANPDGDDDDDDDQDNALASTSNLETSPPVVETKPDPQDLVQTKSVAEPRRIEDSSVPVAGGDAFGADSKRVTMPPLLEAPQDSGEDKINATGSFVELNNEVSDPVVTVAPKKSRPKRRPRLTEEQEKKIISKLKAAAYTQDGVNWEKLFKYYDKDNSGEIGFDEFKRLLRKDAKISASILSDADVRTVFDTVDADSSGEMDYHEFERWVGVETQKKDIDKVEKRKSGSVGEKIAVFEGLAKKGTESAPGPAVNERNSGEKLVPKKTDDAVHVEHLLMKKGFAKLSLNAIEEKEARCARQEPKLDVPPKKTRSTHKPGLTEDHEIRPKEQNLPGASTESPAAPVAPNDEEISLEERIAKMLEHSSTDAGAGKVNGSDGSDFGSDDLNMLP